MPGFIATDSNSEISNLGRGGSDYTASIIANYTNSKVLEIWTDVSGVFSANPKIVKNSRPIESLSYKEAMELSFFGAKVIYFPTLQPLIKKKIPAYIKNTFDPNAIGTCISHSTKSEKKNTVKGISHIENISIINFEGSGMVGVPGFSKRFFDALSQKRVNIIMITQASSEFSICIAVNESDAKTAKDLIDKEFEYEISQNKINELSSKLNENKEELKETSALTEKEENDFLAGVPAIVEAIKSKKIECRIFREKKFHGTIIFIQTSFLDVFLIAQ